MNKIPVSFQHNGKQFSGYFNEVYGVGNRSTWYLMGDDNFYYGSLRQVIQDPIYIDNPMEEKKPEKEAWYFDENDGSKVFAQLVEYFRDVVTAWYE